MLLILPFAVKVVFFLTLEQLNECFVETVHGLARDKTSTEFLISTYQSCPYMHVQCIHLHVLASVNDDVVMFVEYYRYGA